MPEDILTWLWRKAAEAEPGERVRYLEAAKTIEVLRELVGIRDELELEDMEPEGRA